MKQFVKSIAAVMLVGVVLTSALSSVSANGVRATGMDSLVVKVTSTNGTVWGKVVVDYKSGGKVKMLATCSKSKCTFHPPHMVKLILKETPKNNSTWPFKHWKLANGHMKSATSMGSTLKFTISKGMATVWAVYTLKM